MSTRHKKNKTQNNDTIVIKQKQLNASLNKALGIKSPNSIVVAKSKLEQKWEDLDALYEDLKESMGSISVQVAQILNNFKATGTSIPNELSLASNSLYKDLNNMSTDLVAIKSKYEGKSGVVKNEQELSELLEIFNMYYLLFDRFKALTFQELLIITEHTMDLTKKPVEAPSDVQPIQEQPATQVS